MSGGPVDLPAARAVADIRLQTMARGIQEQVDRRVGRVERSAAGLRRVTVLTRDPIARTCEVALDGDLATPVPCGILSRSVVPIVNQLGWATQNGSDLLLLGVDIGRPRAAIYTTRETQSIGAGQAGVDFTAANGGQVDFDTDNDGVESMADLVTSNGQLVVLWTGQWQVEASVRFQNKTTSGANTLTVVRNNAHTLARDEIATNVTTHLTCSATVSLTTEDTVRIYVQSAGSNTTIGYAADDTSGARTRLSAHFVE